MDYRRKKVAMAVLGCKVNQYESEAMVEILKKAGYETGRFDEVCDIYVINTCTVTAVSARKSRQMIRRAKRLNRDAIICVVGCYSQISPGEVLDVGGIDVLMGTSQRGRIAEYIKEIEKGAAPIDAVVDHGPSPAFDPLAVTDFKEKTRANIKIQDGCSNFCSYCIIPYARGPERNRDYDHIMEEVSRISQRGFKEIVLSGIHLASFDKNSQLVRLIKEIGRVEGIERIRLGSVDPQLFSREFISQINEMDKLCPHFHISLQSGCDGTLMRMNRKYTTKMYLDVIEALRGTCPHVSITTDIMVGFPGETHREFDMTYEFAERVKFMKIHVFKYSPRKGTRAYSFSGPVDDDVKEERSKRLLELSDKMGRGFMGPYLGEKVEILAERPVSHESGYNMEGLTDNYMRVFYRGNEADVGTIIKVKIDKILHDALGGEKI